MSKIFEKNWRSAEETLRIFWKQSEASAIALLDRYKLDLIFQTVIRIIVLQIFFASAVFYWLQFSKNTPVTTQTFGVTFLTLLFIFIFFMAVMSPSKKLLKFHKNFLSDIAHELRTPLSNMKTFSELASLDQSINPETRKLLKENEEELDRAGEIINNLLSLNAFIRPEKKPLGDIDLGVIVENVADKMKKMFENKKVSLSIKTRGPNIVKGNRVALEQIAENLLRNALRDSQENGQVTVTVEPDWSGNNILLIRDSGSEIKQDNMFKLFQPFYRTETSLAKIYKSRGLGLSIARGLLKMHSAKISVKKSGKGNLLIISLPGSKQENSKFGKYLPPEAVFDFMSNS